MAHSKPKNVKPEDPLKLEIAEELGLLEKVDSMDGESIS